jgi:hypothetical protein
MQIDGAIVKEQNVAFAIIIVKPQTIQTQSVANEFRRSLITIPDFRGLPIILAAQDSKGKFEYEGRTDIVNFLASIHPSRIPWKRYTLQ